MEEGNVIFKTTTDLKHNGSTLVAGSYLEGRLETFAQQVEAGVMKVIHGATSEAHAAELEGEQAQAAAEAEAKAEAAKPKDTFGPFPPEAENPVKPEGEAPVAGAEAPKEVDAPVLKKYTVRNEHGVKLADGTLVAKDTVVELNANDKVTKFFVDGKHIEEVPEEDEAAKL